MREKSAHEKVHKKGVKNAWKMREKCVKKITCELPETFDQILALLFSRRCAGRAEKPFFTHLRGNFSRGDSAFSRMRSGLTQCPPSKLLWRRGLWRTSAMPPAFRWNSISKKGAEQRESKSNKKNSAKNARCLFPRIFHSTRRAAREFLGKPGKDKAPLLRNDDVLTFLLVT